MIYFAYFHKDCHSAVAARPTPAISDQETAAVGARLKAAGTKPFATIFVSHHSRRRCAAGWLLACVELAISDIASASVAGASGGNGKWQTGHHSEPIMSAVS
ncbi:MAG: hypothetical protein E2O93_07825 [Alphaproteobacteria bacterium]|nr:MAG: hypothetical protein E2O93_07825 [Alphaproteobacteria bacterium]